MLPHTLEATHKERAMLGKRKRYAGLLGVLITLAGMSPILVGAINFEYALLLGFAWIIVTLTLMVLTIIPNASVKLRQTVQNLTVSFIALSFLLTVFDLVVRAIHPVSIYYRPEVKYKLHHPATPLITIYKPGISYDGPLIGDLASVYGNPEVRQPHQFRLTTDAYGYRNRNSDPDRVDLIILGDSFGMGAAVDDGETWFELLSEQSGLNVYNLSISATGPWEQYIHLALTVDRLKTHDETVVIWLMFSGNDLDDIYEEIYEINQLPRYKFLDRIVTVWNDYARHSPLGLLTERVWLNLTRQQAIQTAITTAPFENGTTMLFSEEYLEHQSRSIEEVRQHENLDDLRAVIVAANQLAISKDITLVIVLAPSKGEIYPWLLDGSPAWSADRSPSPFSEVLAEISQEEGVCYLDLKPYLIEASERIYRETGEPIYWYDDSHWNVVGNALVADFIHDSLCLEAGQGSTCCTAAESPQ